MNQFRYIIFGSLLLTACAQAPIKPAAEKPAEPPVAQAEAPAALPSAALPKVELSDDLLYQFLLAEIASQRGDAALAAESSSELARKTRDPRLAMRAAQLALQAGQPDKAVDAVRIWKESDPDSPVAMSALAEVLLRSGRIDEAREEFVSMLQAKNANAGQIFFQIFQMLASYPDKPAAIKLIRGLAQLYPNVAEAHWAVAQLALASGDEQLALSETRQARALRAEWDIAVSLEAHLLRKNAPQQALDVLRAYLSRSEERR